MSPLALVTGAFSRISAAFADRLAGDGYGYGVVAVLGFLVLVAVIINASLSAKVLGFVWLGVGIVVAFVLLKSGRNTDPVSISAVERI